jgi:hypothetical protein
MLFFICLCFRNEQLIEAAKDGRLGDILELLDQGVDFEVKDKVCHAMRCTLFGPFDVCLYIYGFCVIVMDFVGKLAIVFLLIAFRADRRR